MKKLIFLIFTPLAVWSQDTIVTTPPSGIEILDTVTFTATAEESTTTFRFLHPDYNDAFWSTEHLAQNIITIYGLSASSTNLEIVSAVADFNKRKSLHVNSELIQNTTIHPGGPFSIVDHWSLQCGNHADIIANLCLEVTNALGVTPLVLRRVSLSAHQIMEYRDTVLHKWIYLDPDPGTSVFIPRDNGNLVSFSDIQSNPDIILDTTTSVWWTIIPSDEYSRQQYKTFLLPLLSSVNYYPPNYMTDSRDMLYRLPEGAVMKFMMVNNKICTPINSMAGMETIMDECMEAFMNNDSTGISDCITNLSGLSGNDPAFVLQAVMNGNIFITQDSTMVGPKDSEQFCSVTLLPGNYSLSDLQIPHLLRSIEPENTGITFEVSGIHYSDSAFFQMYWPSGTTYLGNPQYVDPSTIQYGITNVYIPDSVGSVTFTFYFNHQLFQFWQKEWKIIVYEGELETGNVDSVGTSSIESNDLAERIIVFPNPTNGIINISESVEQVTIYSQTGSQLLNETITSQIDISQLPAGMYYLTIKNQGKIISKKIIKQ